MERDDPEALKRAAKAAIVRAREASAAKREAAFAKRGRNATHCVQNGAPSAAATASEGVAR